jgi:hypothetical protein
MLFPSPPTPTLTTYFVPYKVPDHTMYSIHQTFAMADQVRRKTSPDDALRQFLEGHLVSAHVETAVGLMQAALREGIAYHFGIDRIGDRSEIPADTPSVPQPAAASPAGEAGSSPPDQVGVSPNLEEDPYTHPRLSTGLFPALGLSPVGATLPRRPTPGHPDSAGQTYRNERFPDRGVTAAPLQGSLNPGSKDPSELAGPVTPSPSRPKPDGFVSVRDPPRTRPHMIPLPMTPEPLLPNKRRKYGDDDLLGRLDIFSRSMVEHDSAARASRLFKVYETHLGKTKAQMTNAAARVWYSVIRPVGLCVRHCFAGDAHAWAGAHGKITTKSRHRCPGCQYSKPT